MNEDGESLMDTQRELTEGSDVEPAVREAAAVARGPTVEGCDANARASMYRFLSAVYVAPCGEDLLRKLRDAELLAEISSLLGKTAVAELQHFAGTDEIGGEVASLKQEYMDLFAVPTGRYVTPFEDVYRGSAEGEQEVRGPLLGERAIAARRMYRAAGAEMDRECKELPTHIGVELAFMAFLCEREEEATWREKEASLGGQGKARSADSNRYRELQSRFLGEHLSKWFPRLSREIRKNAKSSFYRGLAVITEEFLARETEALLGKGLPRN